MSIKLQFDIAKNKICAILVCVCGGLKMREDTVLCKCFNITYKDIKEAVMQGAESYDELSEATCCGQGCGRCSADIAKIFKQIIRTKE